jgi:hypothetical protein
VSSESVMNVYYIYVCVSDFLCVIVGLIELICK